MAGSRARFSVAPMIDIADLKRVHRATWASGDYAAVARLIDDAPPADLFARVPLVPGQDVLDVAAGTGNLAIRERRPKERAWWGSTSRREPFTIARRRGAERAGVDVEWMEGDAEDLPFDGETFDVVLSAFGVQFAPRHHIAADELIRVCRPGRAHRAGQLDAGWADRAVLPDHEPPPAGRPGRCDPAAAVGRRATSGSGLFAGSGVEWAGSRAVATRGASCPRRRVDGVHGGPITGRR